MMQNATPLKVNRCCFSATTTSLGVRQQTLSVITAGVSELYVLGIPMHREDEQVQNVCVGESCDVHGRRGATKINEVTLADRGDRTGATSVSNPYEGTESGVLFPGGAPVSSLLHRIFSYQRGTQEK